MLGNEQGQTNAAHRWRRRHDTRRVTASTALSEVDDGKIISLHLGAEDLVLTFPEAPRCVGCTIDIVVAANPQGRALVLTAAALPQLIVAGATFAQGQTTTLAAVPVGAGLLARSTGVQWHVQVNLLRGISPLDMGGFAITNLGNPQNPLDAANKNYVDNTIAANELRPYARFSRLSPQTILAGQATSVVWPTLDVTKGPAITRSGDGDRFTVPMEGRYHVAWNMVRTIGQDILATWLEVTSSLEPEPTRRRAQLLLTGENTMASTSATVYLLAGESLRVMVVTDRDPSETIPANDVPLVTFSPPELILTITCI